MTPKPLLSLLAASGFVGAVLFFAWPATQGELALLERSGEDASLALPVGGQNAVLPPDSRAQRTAFPASEQHRFNGEVLDSESGKPIEHAFIRITPVSLTRSHNLALWREQDWSAITGATIECTSDVNGRFESHIPNSSGHVFITAHCAGYASQTIHADGDHVVLKLKVGRALKVVVQSDASTPISGATVTLTPSNKELLRPTDGAPQGIRGWFAKINATTDENGVALLSRLEGGGIVFAEHGALKSRVQKVSDKDEAVVLTLRSAVLVSGKVHLPPGETGPVHASITIKHVKSPPGAQATLCCTDKDGRWGPVSIQVQDTKELRLKATATGAVPAHEAALCPNSGESLEVDFYLERAETLNAIVIDQSGDPIVGARAYARWGTSDWWRYSTAYTSESGLARIACPRNQPVALGAQADGYYFNNIEGVLPSSTQGTPRLITLVRAGQLTGTCIFHGPPPEEFKITFWNEERNLNGLKTFASKEGQFTIDSIPVGQLNVLATCVDGQTSTTTLEILPGEDHHVNLAFGPSIEVTGKVIDASSGGPVVATVRLHSVSNGWTMYQYGPTHPSDSDGKFSFFGLSIGANFLKVEAEGYAPWALIHYADGPESVDIGNVRLQRLVTLDVHVSGHSALGDCWLTIDDEEQQFVPPNGLVTFDAMSAGGHSMYLTEADGYGSVLSIEVPAKRRVLIEYEVPHQVELAVTVLPAKGTNLRSGLAAEVIQHDPSDRPISRSKEFRSGGKLTLVGLYPGPAVVRVFDSDHQTLAIRYMRLESSTSNSIRISLEQETSSIVIADDSGTPLPGATLILALPGGKAAWNGHHVADSLGRVFLKAHELSLVEPAVFFESKSDLHNELDLSGTGPHTLTFDASSRLTVTAADRGFPISGLDIYAHAGQTKFHLDNFATDASGSLTWPTISAGPYVLSVEDPTLWPLTREIIVSGDETNIVLDVRRKGSLLLTVKNEFGTPVSNVQVSLTSNEYETQVATWLADELIGSSTGSMRTDDSGQLRISGVPNGDYMLNVQGSTTLVTLPAWSTLEHELTLEPVH